MRPMEKKLTTREWLALIPTPRRDLFYQNFADIRTHELWEWIIDLLPLEHAKDILENALEHNKEESK